jgi:hypothetical protein
MRKLATMLIACGTLFAQEQPAKAPADPAAANPPVRNEGKPMLVPFRCTDEDIRLAGLTCSEDDPCPVYLELSTVHSTGIRLFVAGNIHTTNSTLFTILLGSDDNGQTWREAYERARGAGLDHVQFSGVDTGWVSGVTFSPLPQDPFFLMTTDGGKTWRRRDLFDETRFGSIQQFYFEDPKTGALLMDRGPGSGRDRYELYETNDGGVTWNIRETNSKAIQLKRAPVAPNPDWRVRADGPSKSFHLEQRQGQKWTSLAAFKVDVGACKPE